MQSFPLGGIFTVLILLPNLLFVVFPPKHPTPASPTKNKRLLQVMTLFERAGQATSFLLPFFYPIRLDAPAKIGALVVLVAALLFYYTGWARYLLQGREEELLYRPMMGIPIPMAVAPVVYFWAAGVVLGSVWLALAAAILGVGHLSVSWINAYSGK